MKFYKICLYGVSIIVLVLTSQVQIVRSESESEIQIELHIVTNVRKQIEYPGYVEIIYKGETGSRILLRKLEIITDNKVMEEKRIAKELRGIGNEMMEYETARNVIENVSVSRVASQQELMSAQNAFSRMQELYPIIMNGVHREEVLIDLKEIFSNEFYEGNQKTLNFTIQYEQNGQLREASKSATITRVPDWGSLGPEWYMGDLHLHTNYTDCEPIDFSNAPGWATVEKRWQEADALGLSWFSVTDHNYCLDNDDWKKMKKEIDALMNAKRYFAVLQSAEVSTADDCPCSEGDKEALCLLFSPHCSSKAAHLGVHNIPYLIDSTHNPNLCHHPQWCPDSPTLQYAIDVVNYYYNDSFSIINHPINIDISPTKWFWDCESIQNCNTCGNKQICGYSGIEVWNTSQTGYSPHLGSIDLWKEKLKAGEHVYIYAGSDTESGEYLDGGFNGVYAPYLFSSPEIETRKKKLVDALKKGHLYVSNHPGLFIEVNSNKGATGMMGDTIVVDPNDKIKVHVKVVSKYPGTLKIFKGMNGDEKEWKSININVENFDKIWGDTLKATNTYYRAEFISMVQIGTAIQAYTNPVWLLAIKKFYFGIEIRNDEDSPSIYNDKIVFRKWKYGKSDIGYYWAGGDGEYGTWDETGIKYITKDSYSQDMPVVHKNIILWADMRNVSQIHPYPDIYMYDMGEDEILGTSDDKGEFLVPTDHYVRGRIDVYGNIIVWTNMKLENGEKYYSIKGYDIPTNSVFDISQKSTNEKNNPAIYGNIVVWEEFSKDNLYDIQAYDLFYEKQFSITAIPGNQRYPAIFDHIVIWQDDKNGNNDIYGYDLGVDGIFGTRDDKGETAITKNACNQHSPAIYHNIIIWHDERLQSGSAIYGFDVGLDGILGSFDDKEMGEFQITPAGDISGTPDIYENIIVWTEERKGWDNIIGAYLYFMGPPRIPSDPDLFVPRNDDIVPFPFTSLNFDWPNSMGTPPLTYRFQLSDDINFKSLIYDVFPLEESEFTCTGLLLPSMTYYWRVISSNMYGYSPWSKTWSFSTSECIEPESPKNQSPFPRFLETNICPYPSVTFDWKDYVNMVPVTYEIQLSMDSKFSNSVFYESGLSISDHTYVGRLNPLTKYYWRVRASNRCSSSSWSDVWSFTTGTCMGSSIEFRVTTNPSKQINPAIYGNSAIWLDNRDGDYYVYVCQLPCDGQTERAVFPDLNIQQNPDIYGRNIIWENCPNPRCEIHGYDMGSDGMFGTSDDSGLFQITGNTNSPKNPAIYKNIVVWSETVSEKSDIYGYDMGPDGVFGSRDDRWKFKITNSGACLYPKIYNSIVIWQDARNGYSNIDIYGYDMGPDGAFGTTDDRGEFQITNNPFSQLIPDIYGNIIVWHDTRNKNSGDFDIYGYDMGQDGIFGTLDDRGEFRLPTNNYCGVFLDIYENIIVWSCGKIYGFDLGSDKIYGTPDDGGEFFVSSIYHRIPTSPRIYGDKVVWVDDRNDDGTLKNFDIYGAHLVILSNQGPSISNVNASPNPTHCATNVTLTATINNNGSYFNIAGAEYFIDIAGTDGTGMSMSASDGSFDSLTENVIATIDISPLSAGIHTLYVHGKDELGNWGKIHVINLDVVNDCLGPSTEGISVIPNPTNCDDAIILTATVNDSSTGGSNISAAEYFVDVAGIEGTGIGMSPYDSSYDFKKETVIAIINVEGWASGEHTLYIHGRDAIGNWGGFQSYAFTVTCQRPSSQISNQMTSVAQSHIIQANELLNQINDLLSKAEGKDTSDVEKIINEAKELLSLAKATLATNPIASNNYALKAIEKLKQAIVMLKALLGYPIMVFR